MEPLRWGILGSGLICRDFVGALKGAGPDEARVVCVGARSKASAQSFADALGVERAYEGYAAVVSDPEVDIVYVGTVAQTHPELALLAIEAGKPVLVEKPLALNAEDAAVLIARAREAKVLLVEGMWTRCFPAVCRARELLSGGEIGSVVSVTADFGWPADPDGEHRRTVDPVSGGVAMDVAIGFAAAPALSATVLCTLDAVTPEEVVYSGTRGTLRIHRPAHTPSRLTLTRFVSRTESTEEVLDFPLPPVPAGALPFNYPGSEGFLYEVRAVHEAVRAGALELSQWTHDETVATQAVIDAMRAQARRTRSAGGAAASSVADAALALQYKVKLLHAGGWSESSGSEGLRTPPTPPPRGSSSGAGPAAGRAEGWGLDAGRVGQFTISFVADPDLHEDMEAVSCLCTFCLDDMQIGEELCRLPCMHTFHRRCVHAWLERDRRCMLCRLDVTKPGG
ncbi:unnamed protein product [Prorocentrum cordatum]|uniref:D-xylose 1-dehydrogenase (NADP(+), D-xylono-1,5-lactone-forming) n=1 Tax=Prorocentrum cordatum TaxID=2364126 RepID=A0ABN9VUV5_9DINO|nr:unnamed protein product [Polarella glacialis]